MRRAYWLAPLGVALAAGLFSWLNRGERVILHMGITTFYRAPLTLVLFLAFLCGMLAMMALTLRQDLRVRDELRVRGLLDGHPRPDENAAGAQLRPAHGTASVHGSHAGHAPPPRELDPAPPHPPFAGDGAHSGHDHPPRTGDGDATLSHPPLADRTEYRHSHPSAADDGDATRAHSPFSGHGDAHGRHEPAAREHGDATLIHGREGEPPAA